MLIFVQVFYIYIYKYIYDPLVKNVVLLEFNVYFTVKFIIS